jgi:hypothetical protein
MQHNCRRGSNDAIGYDCQVQCIASAYSVRLNQMGAVTAVGLNSGREDRATTVAIVTYPAIMLLRNEMLEQ